MLDHCEICFLPIDPPDQFGLISPFYRKHLAWHAALENILDSKPTTYLSFHLTEAERTFKGLSG